MWLPERQLLSGHSSGREIIPPVDHLETVILQRIRQRRTANSCFYFLGRSYSVPEVSSQNLGDTSLTRSSGATASTFAWNSSNIFRASANSSSVGGVTPASSGVEKILPAISLITMSAPSPLSCDASSVHRSIISIIVLPVKGSTVLPATKKRVPGGNNISRSPGNIETDETSLPVKDAIRNSTFPEKAVDRATAGFVA